MNTKLFMRNTDILKEALNNINIKQIKKFLLILLLCNQDSYTIMDPRSEDLWIKSFSKMIDELTEFKLTNNLITLDISPASNFLLAMLLAKYCKNSSIPKITKMIERLKDNQLSSSEIISLYKTEITTKCYRGVNNE